MSARWYCMRGITLVLFCAALAPVTVRAQESQPEAPLIASVRVAGNQSISADAILDEVKSILAPGMPLTPERVRQAEEAVMRMGYFAKVAVSSEITDKGAVVTITVVERQRIEKIVFVGNTVLSNEELA
ncbi:MAG: hypothetical protein H5T86_06830, partial [Armatimonadetes bacterium]|nr:hypothetical protein [Armatimonadota bacterium]